MKILLGAFLATVGFLMVPSIQCFFSEKFSVRRQFLSYIGVLAVIALVFAVVPRGLWQIVLGVLFMGIAATMLWIVPRNDFIRKWMQESFFGDNDILDEDAPYAKVVSLFKWPLMGLGLWVIAPWTVILLDIAAIAGAFFWWMKRSADANNKKRTDSAASDAAANTSTI